MVYKTCNVCNTSKPTDEFYKNNSCVGGFFHRCKICMNEIRKNISNEKKELLLIKKRARRRKVSVELILEEDRLVNGAKKIGKKYCFTCSRTLDLTFFNKHSITSDGLSTICKECKKKKNKDHYDTNTEIITQNKKEYFQKNKEKKIKYTNDYAKLRRKNDPLFRLCFNIRGRLRGYLKTKDFRRNNKNSFFYIVGCTPDELRIHLESKFTDGMNWDNYGASGWHVDHIIPISSANDFDEVIKLNHYSNLQPLWAEDNYKKSKKNLTIESEE
jgi:hypothetical protein